MIILRYIHCYWLMIYLSITEGIWRIPKLTLSPDNYPAHVSMYNERHITICNDIMYLEVFYHEWRHFYQDITDTCNYHDYNFERYTRYKDIFYQMRKNTLLAHHFPRVSKMFKNEFLFEKDAMEYHIKKCPNGKLAIYFKKLMS